MGIYSTKPGWQRFLRPVVSFSLRYRIQPDFYSYGGMILGGLAGLCLYLAGSNLLWLWLAPVAIILRLTFNLLDGLVARQMAIADANGELKNEFGDRLADFLTFAGLLLGGSANLALGFIAVSLIMMVSYLGILSKAIHGVRLYVGIFGKGDRMLSLALFCLIVTFTGDLRLFNVYLALAIAAALVTIVQRLRAISRAAKPPA